MIYCCLKHSGFFFLLSRLSLIGSTSHNLGLQNKNHNIQNSEGKAGKFLIHADDACLYLELLTEVGLFCYLV